MKQIPPRNTTAITAALKELPPLDQSLVKALDDRDLDKFTAYLKGGANPNVAIEEVPLLLTAASWGERKFVESLLAAGADPDVQVGNVPALIWIVWSGSEAAHVQCAEALIDGGADVTIKTQNILGTVTGTALDMAVASGKKEMALMLHRRRVPCTKATLAKLRSIRAAENRQDRLP